MKILIRANTQQNSSMTIEEFIASVKAIYNEYFPNGECVAVNRQLMGSEYLMIRWYLSANSSECLHNIRDNDLFHIAFNIDLVDNTRSGEVYDVVIRDNSVNNDKYMPSIITLDVMSKGMLRTPEVSYLAYSHINLPFRKTTGSPEKILATLRKYAEKLHVIFTDGLEQGIIPEDHLSLVKFDL